MKNFITVTAVSSDYLWSGHMDPKARRFIEDLPCFTGHEGCFEKMYVNVQQITHICQFEILEDDKPKTILELHSGSFIYCMESIEDVIKLIEDSNK